MWVGSGPEHRARPVRSARGAAAGSRFSDGVRRRGRVMREFSLWLNAPRPRSSRGGCVGTGRWYASTTRRECGSHTSPEYLATGEERSRSCRADPLAASVSSHGHQRSATWPSPFRLPWPLTAVHRCGPPRRIEACEYRSGHQLLTTRTDGALRRCPPDGQQHPPTAQVELRKAVMTRTNIRRTGGGPHQPATDPSRITTRHGVLEVLATVVMALGIRLIGLVPLGLGAALLLNSPAGSVAAAAPGAGSGPAVSGTLTGCPAGTGRWGQ